MSTTRTMTETELMALPGDGLKREYVDGEIRVSPAGFRHGLVSVALSALLHAYVSARKLGYVCDSSTGFWMPSGNLRLPDVAFVSRERMPDGPPESFSRVVPDLAVEVLSPTDSERHVLDKVGEYLASGVRLVWVVDPQMGRAVVYRSLTSVRQIPEDGLLEGEDVILGFSCRLTQILAT